MASEDFNVLFLGAGNAVRSILAEAMLNRKGAGRFRAASAGVRPAGAVDEKVQRLLNSHYFDIAPLRPKPVAEFEGPEAPRFDVVIDLRDKPGKGAPAWPGEPILTHWPMANPIAARGTDDEVRAAYGEAYRMLTVRIGLLLALPVAGLDRAALQARLDDIGQQGGPPVR